MGIPATNKLVVCYSTSVFKLNTSHKNIFLASGYK